MIVFFSFAPFDIHCISIKSLTRATNPQYPMNQRETVARVLQHLCLSATAVANSFSDELLKKKINFFFNFPFRKLFVKIRLRIF